MRIHEVVLKNLGVVENLKVAFRSTSDGNVPIVLVGQNGTGKSLTLSVILDAMTEIRRMAFSKLSEVEGTDYARISTRNYVSAGTEYSHASVSFDFSGQNIVFNEIVRNTTQERFQEVAQELLSITNSQPEFAQTGFLKGIAVLPPHLNPEVVAMNYLFFPHFRYERSAWLSATVKVEFADQQRFVGQSHISPIRTSIIEETRRWILNIILDRELYERKIANFATFGVASTGLPVFLGYEGPNTNLFIMISEVIKTMIQAKYPDIISARIGIGKKNNRQIAVFMTRGDGKEESVAPDINMMSSGELMILSLILEIIRSYEAVNGAIAAKLDEITGIVVIDEVDLHLHVGLQREILPRLIRRFPRVQFLITSHSPFFAMGMQETGEVDIINLPIGNVIDPEDYTEFQETYNIFISKNQQFKSRYESLLQKVTENNRPLLITEGKTDWQHLRAAMLKFKNEGRFSSLDIDFFEFDDSVDMGDARLRQMCESMSLIRRERKVIFIFDRDNKKIIDTMSGMPDNFRSLGNNVYSLCIPAPAHRAGYENISIELYYTDDDLKTPHPRTGKKLWFTNQIKIVTEPNGGGTVIEAQNDANQTTELKKKIYDDNIEKIQDPAGNPAGISKALFASDIACDLAVSANFDRSAFSAIFEIIEKII